MKKVFISLILITFVANCFSKMIIPISFKLYSGKIIKGVLYDMDEDGYYIMVNKIVYFIKKDKISSVIQNEKEIDIEDLTKIEFYGTGDHKIFDYRFNDFPKKEQKKKKVVIQKAKKTYNLYLLPLSIMAFMLGSDYYNQSKDLKKLIKEHKESGLDTNDLEKTKNRKDLTYITCYVAGVCSLVYSFSYKKAEISVSPTSVELSYNF